MSTKNSILRSFTGPLTEKLVREPGEFGLGQVPADLAPDSTTDMVCGFCSTGCSLKVHLKDNEAVNLTPSIEYPVNLGMACPKGWEALTPLESEDRGTDPLVKVDGKFVKSDWDGAMQQFRSRLNKIKEEHGSDSLAFLSTGQMCTEEMAYLGMLAKSGLGFSHGDGNTRQCMSTSVVAYKQSFGFDAPPYTYADFEESDCIVLIGSNLAIAHPIMWQRVLRNKNNPDIIVIDPRKTETASAATLHLAIQPKSDLDFLYGVSAELIKQGLVDKEYVKKNTTGFSDYKKFLEDWDINKASESSGVSIELINQFIEKIKTRKNVSLWWTMGVNQSHQATRTAQAIINIALMTGNIGRPGTGANSITGQCNAMGSRLFSNTTSLLGGRDFNNPEHRKEVSAITGISENRIPKDNCLAYDQIITGIEEGRIKALWVIATNTAHSWSGGGKLAENLKKLDLLVVQDMYHNTATAKLADVYFPAAGWGEKDGTFINSERRIGLAKKVKRAPGVALSDFNILKLAANSFGLSDEFNKWESPEEVFKMLAELSKERPCDFSGVTDYQDIEEQGGIQWPLVDKKDFEKGKERRLFEDGKFYTADEKAKFIFEEPVPHPEVVSDKYPYTLLTGRGSSAQWHTETRTGKSEVLKKLHGNEIYCEINPIDAESLKLTNNDLVEVKSRRGELRAKVRITNASKEKEVFIPMHFIETNRLTKQIVDPYSRQPSYKYSAVLLTKI